MKKIIEIVGVEMRRAAMSNKEYWRTHAILEDGTECVGFSKDFKVGDEVEVFFHYGQVKMRKGKDER